MEENLKVRYQLERVALKERATLLGLNRSAPVHEVNRWPLLSTLDTDFSNAYFAFLLRVNATLLKYCQIIK